jgi:hypothetical protein
LQIGAETTQNLRLWKQGYVLFSSLAPALVISAALRKKNLFPPGSVDSNRRPE